MLITIQIRFGLKRFRKDFSVRSFHVETLIFFNTFLSSADEKLDGTSLEQTTISDDGCYDLKQIYDTLGKILIN